MKNSYPPHLEELFLKWAGEETESFTPLPPSGSDRRYFRISGATKSAIGTINHNKKENRAFIEFSRHFKALGLPVPEIFNVSETTDSYLQEDFGNTTLFDWLSTTRIGKDIPTDIVTFYKKSLEHLIHFQTEGAKELDFSLCYPRHSFDKQSMLWDLHYFKYYFLKLAGIPFDEQLLEDDFNAFAEYLQKADGHYFMYRDFQSRNIMVTDNGPAFIDYQGGRKGPLQYDLASVLYDAKADLPEELRSELLDFYISKLRKKIKVNESSFKSFLQGFVLIRIMQAMGAYGFRGFYENKEHFLKSIPYAIENLRFILSNLSLPEKFPALEEALWQVTKSQKLQQLSETPKLTISIHSFSYRRGIPVDDSGHGGGFVFDCRCIHNPGRYEEYKSKTGLSPEVIAFFEKEEEMDQFLTNVYQLADQSVQKYLKRGFKHLMFSFGCTGGQHRSVYCAENLARHLRKQYPVNIELKHMERASWPL
ncbi:RapZ C-terminal domain-containing protein [Marinilabilia salmonicolor]|uniref:RapZ C-terminal domain-containing protein n=1 Tax=Marinilabilia salmonicolor TaxID=989 RepID=UPI00029AD040|nr:RNase adapter RapZ [Marinilabilia salmonicolor]